MGTNARHICQLESLSWECRLRYINCHILRTELSTGTPVAVSPQLLAKCSSCWSPVSSWFREPYRYVTAEEQTGLGACRWALLPGFFAYPWALLPGGNSGLIHRQANVIGYSEFDVGKRWVMVYRLLDY